MRKVLYSLLLVFCAAPVFMQAQTLTGEKAQSKIKGSILVKVDEHTKNIEFVKFEESFAPEIKGDENILKNILSLDAEYSFKAYDRVKGQNGSSTIKYQLYYKSYPIEHNIYHVNYDIKGLRSLNGKLNLPQNIDVNIAISEDEAFKLALENIPAKKYIWETTNSFKKPKGKIVLINENEVLVPSYKFDIFSIDPMTRQYVYVDARNGKIVKTINRIQNTNVTGTAETLYNGTQNITTDNFSAGNYRLRETTRGSGIETYDMNESTDYSTAVDFTDSDNYWNVTTNFDNAAYDTHYSTQKTYDYYFNTFGRNSFDDAGSALISYVHFSSSYANAFWNGSFMTYGDGDGLNYTPLTTTDIIAHEITHGVTEYTAGLIYSYESGALNESFSDIFGITVDFYANPGAANYIMGEQISATPIRSMEDPNSLGDPDTYLGNYWYFGSGDNGGVHTNSGVQNYWFYLLCEGGTGTNDNGDYYNITGIGMQKAAQIAYRNLSVYLVPGSQYSDARFYSVQAAIDLYGQCSPELIAVTDAWHAVGVGNSFSNSVVADFSVSHNYSCQAPATFNFTDQSTNASNYSWDFGDGTTSNIANPSHEYLNPGNYSVQLIVTGSAICSNSDTISKIDFINVEGSSGPTTPTCTPGTNNTSSAGIYGFSLNTINATDQISNSYQDKTCLYTTSITEGKKYAATVNTSIQHNESVWIWADLNADGSFNNSELVFESLDKLQNHTREIIFPEAQYNDSLLLLRVASDVAGYNISNACSNSNYGQYEDYSILVLENTEAPEAEFSINNTSIKLGETASFKNETQNLPTSFEWLFPGAIPSASNSENPEAIYNSIGTYDVTLIVHNTFGSDTLTKIDYIEVKDSYIMCEDDSSNSVSGTLYDSGGETGNYSNRENCSFLISVPCSDTIELSFNFFQLESCCDYFSVYDGRDISGNLLLSTNGSSIPPNVIATSGNMFIRFTTDGSVVYQGFEAAWNAKVPPSNPPVANFEVSDTTPAFNVPVQLTDLSSGDPYRWTWVFDNDSLLSTEQNPKIYFKNKGVHDVTLFTENCNGTDTANLTIIVQEPPVIDVDPVNITDTIFACGGFVENELSIKNTGIGDLHCNFESYKSFDSTSTAFYISRGAQTVHNFSNLTRLKDSIEITVIINGDFDRDVNYANLIIDNDTTVRIEDEDVPNGTNITQTFKFPHKKSSAWLADGILSISIQNSYRVRASMGGDDKHLVKVLYNTNRWMEVSDSAYIVQSNDSLNIPVKFLSDGRISGTYFEDLELIYNSSGNTQMIIPCSFTIQGSPELDIQNDSVGFGEIMRYTTLDDSVLIYNSGCDTLKIYQINLSSGQFSISNPISFVEPFDSNYLHITFAPDLVGTFIDTLNLLTSDIDTIIKISGISLHNPVISTSADSLYLETFECDDTITTEITIYNNGQGALNGLISVLGNTSFEDNFDNGIELQNWYSIVGGISSNNCGTYQGLNALYFNSSGQRSATTKLLNTINGGLIEFYLKYGSGSYGCEQVDNGENIVLEYSVDGLTWTNLLNCPLTNLGSFNSYSQDIPLAAQSGNTMFRWRQLSNSGGGMDNWVIDEVSIRLDNLITSTEDTIQISPSDSLITQVQFDGIGLNTGIYHASLKINSNDPLNGMLDIPVTVKIDGEPSIQVSKNSIHFPLIVEQNTISDSLYILNQGCDTLFISNVTFSDTLYSGIVANSSILPNDSSLLTINFSPLTEGNYIDTLDIFNNDVNISIILTANVLGAPVYTIDKESIEATVNICQPNNLTIPVTISNTGKSDLIVKADFENISNTREVVALTYGVDYYGEYQNTLAAINQRFTDYNLTEINTTDASALEASLQYKDILLIAEQEYGSPSVFTTFSPVLNNFINDGGTVIFCGNYSTSHINNSGLLYSNYVTSISGYVNVSVTPDELITDLGTTVLTTSATYPQSFNNPDIVSLIKYNDYDIFCYRNIGKGKVIYIAFDYYQYNDDASIIISNSIKYGSREQLPDWLSIDEINDTIAIGNSRTFDVIINTENGELIDNPYDLVINTNDPWQRSDTLSITIIDMDIPCADYTYATYDCSGVFHFSDLSKNNPNLWYWDFGDGNISHMQNPAHEYAVSREYEVKFTVSNENGNSSDSSYISVVKINPKIEITGEKRTGQELYFEEINKGVTDWLWDFGDGSISSSENPTHVYLNSGNKSISLTVSRSSCVKKIFESIYIQLNTGIEDDLNNTHFTLFPNPTSGLIYLEFKENISSEVAVKFISVEGKILYTDKLKNIAQNDRFNFDISHFPMGNYFINITINNKTNSYQIIKQ